AQAEDRGLLLDGDGLFEVVACHLEQLSYAVVGGVELRVRLVLALLGGMELGVDRARVYEAVRMSRVVPTLLGGAAVTLGDGLSAERADARGLAVDGLDPLDGGRAGGHRDRALALVPASAEDAGPGVQAVRAGGLPSLAG